jgi:hypothetical protein
MVGGCCSASAAVESYRAWRIVFKYEFAVCSVVRVLRCVFSWHVGLVLSVGFVVMLGQGRRSRSRDTDAQARRALARLSSVDMRVLVVCVPQYLGKQPRDPV